MPRSRAAVVSGPAIWSSWMPQIRPSPRTSCRAAGQVKGSGQGGGGEGVSRGGASGRSWTERALHPRV
jgi:hypothetical protein